MKKKLSIKKIFSLSWADFKKHWKIAIPALIPLFLIEVINGIFGVQEQGQWIGDTWVSTGMEGSWTVTIVATLVSLFIMIGLIKIFLNIVDGKKATFMQQFETVNSIKHYVLFVMTYILTSLAIAVPALVIAAIIAIPLYFLHPMIAFITAGIVMAVITIYVIVSLQFSYYFSAEERYTPIDAIKKSWSITKGNKGTLFLLLVLVILLIIISIIPLGLGLIISIPLTMLMYSHTYRILDPEIHTNANEQIQTETGETQN